jgi:hypothetical protein
MVRVHPDPPRSAIEKASNPGSEPAGRGAVAQLGEHLLCKQGVVGSIPISSTSIQVSEVRDQESVESVSALDARPAKSLTLLIPDA